MTNTMHHRGETGYLVGRYLTDLTVLVGSLYLARWLRMVLPWGQPLDVEGAAINAPMLVLAVIVWSLTLVSMRTLDPRKIADRRVELQAVAASVVVANLVYAGLLYLTYRGLSRLLFVYFVVLNALLTVCGRMFWQHLMRRRGLDRRRVLIIATQALGEMVMDAFAALEGHRFKVVALFAEALADGEAEANPTQQRIDQARAVIASESIGQVVLAFPSAAQVQLGRWIAVLQHEPVAVTVVPDYASLVLSRARVERIGDLVLIGLNEPVIGPMDRAIKRALDLTVASIGLLLLAPVFLIVGLAVALDSPGPVLYRSERIGEGGREFAMLKFRTMIRGADRQEEELVAENPLGHLDFAKHPEDPRVTRVGRVLRRLSLDELPQLWNVLKGEMSLVGPRPELPALVSHYEPWQQRRFSVPQGMTGWWQISGRSEKAKHLHVEDDLYYIRNYSLPLDLQILWRTIGAVVRGRGAY